MAAPTLPTLASLRQGVYDEFDEGLQNYIQIPEMNRYINDACSELYNWLVASGEDYFFTEVTGSFANGTTDFALPADFMKVTKMFTLPGYVPMKRLMPDEFRGSSSVSNAPLMFGNYGIPTGYLLIGNFLRIVGQYAPNDMFSLWYVPICPQLVLDTDTWAIPYIPGWAQYVVTRAAIKCRIKEESDPTELRTDLALIKQNIETDMQNRDMGRHRHVVDAEGLCPLYRR